MAASSGGASRPPHRRPSDDKRSDSFRLTKAKPRRSRGDDGRGDLAESPEPEGSKAPKVEEQIETPRLPDPIMRRPSADREEKRVTYGNGLRQEKQLDTSNPNQRRLSMNHLAKQNGKKVNVLLCVLFGYTPAVLPTETVFPHQ
jgi:hypothetical protein